MKKTKDTHVRKDTETKKKLLLEVLERNLGIITSSCRETGISRNTFYEWYKDDEDFRKSVDDINEITLDFAESQLMQKIREGSERSIFFYMKYKAKKRGYIETQEIEHKGDGITINIVKPKKDEDIDE